MDRTKYPITGTCRCDRTAIEISAPPIMTAACHCRGCQKMSSSAFSLTAMVSPEAFRVVRGEPVRGGAKTAQLEHYFCPDCMTWMFTRIVGVDMFLNVRPTMFDAPDLCRPFIETVTAEKQPWAETPAKYKFEHFPPMDQFGPLLQEYAESR